MSIRVAAFSLALALLAQPAARAQTCVPPEDQPAHQGFHVQLSMELSGKITVRQDGKPLSFAQTAKAKHDFLERILISKAGVASKSARYYEAAEVVLVRDKNLNRSVLKP